MKVVRDPETEAWLAEALESLEWDEGNLTKNRKHRVEPEDVEQIFSHSYVFFGRVIEPAHEEPRWVLLGRNDEGRKLTLVFTRRENRLRPISCRSMRRNERIAYGQEIGDEDEG